MSTEITWSCPLDRFVRPLRGAHEAVIRRLAPAHGDGGGVGGELAGLDLFCQLGSITTQAGEGVLCRAI